MKISYLNRYVLPRNVKSDVAFKHGQALMKPYSFVAGRTFILKRTDCLQGSTKKTFHLGKRILVGTLLALIFPLSLMFIPIGVDVLRRSQTYHRLARLPYKLPDPPPPPKRPQNKAPSPTIKSTPVTPRSIIFEPNPILPEFTPLPLSRASSPQSQTSSETSSENSQPPPPPPPPPPETPENKGGWQLPSFKTAALTAVVAAGVGYLAYRRFWR